MKGVENKGQWHKVGRARDYETDWPVRCTPPHTHLVCDNVLQTAGL